MLSLRFAAAVVAGLAVGAGGGFAVAGAVRGDPPEKAAALGRLESVATTDSSAEPAPAPSSAPQPIPGRMLDSTVPVPISPSILRARNGWLVSDGRTLVAVYAGAAGSDPEVGRVVIVRQNLVAGKQAIRIVDAGPTGALTIAAAPLGASVETSAQTGEILLRSAAGAQLLLDLGAAKVSHVAHGASLPWRGRPPRTSDSASPPIRR
jgi:hypothetical protein